MIHLPSSVRVYVCLSACDMRKNFDGLSALVRDALELDALAGHLYVFAIWRRDRVKILYWDRDGFAVCTHRRLMGNLCRCAVYSDASFLRKLFEPRVRVS